MVSRNHNWLEEEVLLITLKNFKTKKLITFGSRPYNVKRDDVDYILCSSEYDLLYNFVDWWEEVWTRSYHRLERGSV